MIIVGSRCGGFNFYAKKTNTDNFIWLGPTKDSDLDYFSDKIETINNFSCERFGSKSYFYTRFSEGFPIRAKTKFPYLAKNVLHIPNDKTYLSVAIKKKIRKYTNLHSHIGTEYEIYSPDGIYLTKMNFKFPL